MRKKIIFSFVFSLVCLSSAGAQTITSIRIVGTHKIEKAVIYKNLTSKKGEVYTSSSVRRDIKKLYELGYFENISVYKKDVSQGVELSYVIEEKPIIKDILTHGFHEIDKEDIEALISLKKYSFLNISDVKRVQEAILNLYTEKGFTLSDVRYEISQKDKNNQIEVHFYISEVAKVAIKKITFVGNHALSSEELKSKMFTKEKDIWYWITDSGVFKEEIFQRDVSQGLVYYYLMNGYVDIKISEPQITLSPDKTWLYLTVTLQEGEKHHFGKVDFSKGFIKSQGELSKESKIKTGEIYNHDLMRQEIERLTNLYKDEGFAYANIIPRTNINREKKTVDLYFDFEKGEQIYIGEINVQGNIKTRDKVIRRELRIKEGELYNETNIQTSLSRLHRLGFFEEIDLQKKEYQQGKIDLVFKVKEKPTGSFNFGAGFSSAKNIFLQGSVAQNNLFGRGHVLNFSTSINAEDQLFDLGFNEPYLFDTLWNTGVNAFRSNLQQEAYTQFQQGGVLQLGHSFWDYGNVSLSYKLQKIELTIPTENTNIISASLNNGIESSLTTNVSFDVRNNVLSPTKGSFHSLSVGGAGLGGDHKYLKTDFDSRWYFPLLWNNILRLRVDAGAIEPYAGRDAPHYIRYVLGGPRSLRGFDPLTIGPKALNNATPPRKMVVGGRYQVLFNAEYEIPVLKELQLKSVLFFDYGNAFNSFDLSDFRGDVGFGFRWVSPMGPLRLEWGFPLAKKEGERSPVFNFVIAPAF